MLEFKHYLRRGGGAKSKPFEELFQLKFGHFLRKGGEQTQIQIVQGTFSA